MIQDKSKVDDFYRSMIGTRVKVFITSHKVVGGEFLAFDDVGIILKTVSGQTMITRASIEGVSPDRERVSLSRDKLPVE